MRAILVSLAMVVATIGLVGERFQKNVGVQPSPCAMVEEAFDDFHHLKVGMTRREVEKHFIRDGGLQFPDSTSYTYYKCDYIKLSVEFKPAPPSAEGLSPNDTVTKLSTLFVALPKAD